jgi:decaprenylphospho-beta-D-ribofuranose 2-oxidase
MKSVLCDRDAAMAAQPGSAASLTNWSRSEHSPCCVRSVRDIDDIAQALALAREHDLTVIPHGAGHSFTDAALNTRGMVLDLTGMRRVLAWNPEQGIMRVEPGATLLDVIRVALSDGWWPAVAPSTSEATIGGCVAMNVTGKNAWRCGSFGEYVLSLDMLLADGRAVTLSAGSDRPLFWAVIGSAGLLGVITSITLQLRRITSERVSIRTRPAASFGEIFAIFEAERSADYLEALVDGFAGGSRLGRGIVNSIRSDDVCAGTSLRWPAPCLPDAWATELARSAGRLGRPVVRNGVRWANAAIYRWHRQGSTETLHQRSLFHSTFYPPAAFAGYHALLPHGIVSFQAFVPHRHVEAIFTTILQRSQAIDQAPLLCVVKRHRSDPFLLSYQVDGFSLEAYYQIIPRTELELRSALTALIDPVIEVGGRFSLAKDALLTSALYRRSVGDAAVETFLDLKRRCDPGMLFQSDLFRRVFSGYDR